MDTGRFQSSEREPSQADSKGKKGLQCKKCGSTDITVQAVTETETKHRGCIGWAFWILLVCLTFGLLIIIPLLTNSKTKSKTHTEAVCQNCGSRWKV